MAVNDISSLFVNDVLYPANIYGQHIISGHLGLPRLLNGEIREFGPVGTRRKPNRVRIVWV